MCFKAGPFCLERSVLNVFRDDAPVIAALTDTAAVDGGRAAVPGPADALAALKVAEAAERSIETGEPVRLGETGDGYELG